MLGIGLVAGILALGNATMVSAQPLSIMDEVETSADYAEDTSYSLLRGNHLNLGTVKVQRLSSNEITIYGLTQCHHSCA